jgi:hypothetical protein
MAEHRIRKNNIIYIIPNDDLFEKWKSNEAFIDEYGRLMNRKPHRVLKELKHYVDTTPATSATVPTRKEPSLGNQVKDIVRDNLAEASRNAIGYAVDRATDKLFYEVLPNVWHEHIVPFFHDVKEALTSKGTKAETVLRESRTNTEIVTARPKVTTKMTQEEADAEKRKVLYHWLGMLSSLKKLYDAGEIDNIDSIMAQLTEAVTLERVNALLSENPNLLETDRYIELHSLLGRDLYREKQLIPIEVSEITKIAETYGYESETDKMEDN